MIGPGIPAEYARVAGWCDRMTIEDVRSTWTIEMRVHAGRGCTCWACRTDSPLPTLVHRRRIGSKIAEQVQHLAPAEFYETPDGRPAFDNITGRMMRDMLAFEESLKRPLPRRGDGGTDGGGRGAAA